MNASVWVAWVAALLVFGCGDPAVEAPAPSPAPAPAPEPPAPPDSVTHGPMRVASGLLQAIGWAGDDQHLYWLQHDGQDPLGDEHYPGSIWRVRIEANATPEALARDLRSPAGLGADETFLYFARAGAAGREVVRIRKTGGAIETLFRAEGIPMLVSDHLYWEANDVIQRHAKDGTGADEIVVDPQANGAEIVAFDVSPEIACVLAVADRAATVECGSPGAAPRTIARERSAWVAGVLAIDGRHVYWRSVERHGELMRASLDGPPAPARVLSASDPSGPIEFVAARGGRLFVEEGLLGLHEIDPATRAARMWIPEMSRMSGSTDYLPIFLGRDRLAWVGFGLSADGDRSFDDAGIWTTTLR